MDIVVSVIILSIIIFLVLCIKAKKNNVPILQKIYDIVLYSFTMSIGIILALSLIAYGLTEKIILGLTFDFIRVGVFIGGIVLLIAELIHLSEKFDKKNS